MNTINKIISNGKHEEKPSFENCCSCVPELEKEIKNISNIDKDLFHSNEKIDIRLEYLEREIKEISRMNIRLGKVERHLKKSIFHRLGLSNLFLGLTLKSKFRNYDGKIEITQKDFSRLKTNYNHLNIHIVRIGVLFIPYFLYLLLTYSN